MHIIAEAYAAVVIWPPSTSPGNGKMEQIIGFAFLLFS